MTLSLVLCFYLIFDQYRGEPNNETILNLTILSLIVVVVTLLISNKLAANIKDIGSHAVSPIGSWNVSYIHLRRC